MLIHHIVDLVFEMSLDPELFGFPPDIQIPLTIAVFFFNQVFSLAEFLFKTLEHLIIEAGGHVCLWVFDQQSL